MTEYTEFVKKAQADILSTVKHVQETNLKAMHTFTEAVAEYTNKAKTMSPVATLPTPAEVIESTFGFTAQLVDLQKQYYVRIAEAIAAAQKKAGEFATPAKKSDK
ncbi:MAG TPA: hypothetical protein VEJ20_08275 [Candidatus Eremiobacteraceae bacterium]|nr:hypothetical protein [Candidatus Eremiobacteraceae bacterium]